MLVEYRNLQYENLQIISQWKQMPISDAYEPKFFLKRRKKCYYVHFYGAADESCRYSDKK